MSLLELIACIGCAVSKSNKSSGAVGNRQKQSGISINFNQKYTILAVVVASAMIFALSLDTIFCFIYNV